MLNSSALTYEESELYNYTNITNPIYIVTGGAGAPLYNVYANSFIAKAEEAYHFILLEVKKEINRTSLFLEAWKIPQSFGTLELLDNITIMKYY